MPSRYNVVQPSLYDRTYRNLSLEAKVVLNYILNCPVRSTEGLFRLPMRYIAVDVDLPEDAVEQALREIDGQWVEYDFDDEICLDCLALKWNPIRKPTDNRITQAVNLLRDFVHHPFFRKFAGLAETYSQPLAQRLYEEWPFLLPEWSSNGRGSGPGSEGVLKGVQDPREEPSRDEERKEHEIPQPRAVGAEGRW